MYHRAVISSPPLAYNVLVDARFHQYPVAQYLFLYRCLMAALDEMHRAHISRSCVVCNLYATERKRQFLSLALELCASVQQALVFSSLSVKFIHQDDQRRPDCGIDCHGIRICSTGLVVRHHITESIGSLKDRLWVCTVLRANKDICIPHQSVSLQRRSSINAGLDDAMETSFAME